MAIIFFDGFNRDFDSAHWTRTDPVNMVLNGTARTNSAPNSMYLYGGETLDYRLALNNIGTHSSKKLYMGFVLRNYVVDTADLTPYPDGRPFLRFYDSSDNLVLTIAVDSSSAGSNSQVSYGDDVYFNIVQAGAVVDSYNIGVATTTSGTKKVIADNTWRYFEFEFDIDSATNTVAMRVEGTPVVNSNATETTALTTIANIAKIEFVAGRLHQPYYWQPGTGTFIDDFYLVDDTGTRENTWLGPDTVVRNINVETGNFDGGVTTNQWYSTGDDQRLHTDDGDTSGIRSNAFNQYQLYNWDDIDTNSLPPGTLVGALRVFTKAKNASLDAAYKIVGENALGSIYDLSAKYVLSNNTYTIYGPEYVLNNPSTTDRWTVPEINSFKFGVKSENPV